MCEDSVHSPQKLITLSVIWNSDDIYPSSFINTVVFHNVGLL